MTISNRCSEWIQRRRRPRRAAAAVSRRASRFSPCGETLEDRQLLAILVTNHGGAAPNGLTVPELQNPNVVAIYSNWAGNGAVQAGLENDMNTFLQSVIANNTYWSGLAQYKVGNGTWGGSFDIKPAAALNTSQAVVNELNADFGMKDLNGNPIPKPNPASTIDVVFLPPGDIFTASTQQGGMPRNVTSANTFTALHSWYYAQGGNNLNYAYVVVPYPGNGNLTIPGLGVFAALTADVSHELVEAATDPVLTTFGDVAASGWFYTPSGGSGEIADLCSPQVTTVQLTDPTTGGVNSNVVSVYWSNFIPLSTTPHSYPTTGTPVKSTFQPTSGAPPIRPTQPAPPSLPNTTSPPAPTHSGPSIPGGPSLVQPAIAASNVNPSDLAVASQNGLQISTNNGASWSALIPFPSASGGDSSVVYDKTGDLDWSYLNPTTGGITIATLNPSTGKVIAGPFTVDAPPSGYTDVQQFLVGDNPASSPQSNNLYLAWTRLGPSGSSQILLSVSGNQGKTWSTPAVVAASSAGSSPPTYYYGATVTAGPNGAIYVAYHAQPGYTTTANGGIVPDGVSGQTLAAIYTYTSSTGTLTQQGSTITAFAAGQSDITFNDQEGSRTIAGTTFLTQGSVIPYVLVDPAQPGTVYVVTAEDPDAGTSNPPSSEVVMATLTQNADGTWSTATSVIAPPASSSIFQLFPTATIDQQGDIVVSWYSNPPLATTSVGDDLLDVYATYSTDGGQTWATPFQVNSQAFNPAAGAATVLGGAPVTTGIGNSFGVAIDSGTVFVAHDANTFNPTTGVATGQQVAVDSFAIPGTLTILPVAGNNVITIGQLAGDPGVDVVQLNGVTIFTGSLASLTGGIQIQDDFDLDGDAEGGGTAPAPDIANDTLILNYSNGDPLPAAGITFDAAEGGTNLIEVNADSNDTLSDSSLTISGNSVAGTDTIALDNVTAAQLTGGPSNDVFTLNGWSGTTTITGGTGTNSLVVASGTVATSTLTVSNVATVSVTGGTLDVNTSFSSIPAVQVQGAGTLELDNGVTLTADVTNAGILSLGGANIAAATIAGNYDQTGSGTLDIKLGGTGAGQYDQLHVTGDVTLAGTLSVGLVDGFSPTAGDSFQIITYMGTLTGDFTTESFPTLGNGNAFQTSSGNGSYTLSVTT